MDPNHAVAPPFWRSTAGMTLVVALLLGGFYLITEHTVHLLGALPYLLLLACPLMHLFMHRGHGHQHGQPGRPDDAKHRQ